MVWTAACDAAAPDPSNEGLDKTTLVKLRQEAILDQIHEAETTYTTGDRARSCLGGYRNRLIMSLNKAHECVQIVQLGSEARDMAVDSLKFWIKRELMLLPLPQQKAILKAWSSMDEEEKRANNQAYQFHSNPEYIQKLKALIKNTFMLTIQERESLFDPQYWYSFQRPILHSSLDQLMQKIESILILPNTSAVYRFLATRIQEAAKNAFDETRSYEEDYQWLNEQYAMYCKIKAGLEALEQSSPTFPSFKTQINTEVISCLTLVSCIEMWQRNFQSLEKPQNSRENIIKNVCMICLPIIGWLFLLVRFIQREELFYTTADQKSYSRLQKAIMSLSAMSHKFPDFLNPKYNQRQT